VGKFAKVGVKNFPGTETATIWMKFEKCFGGKVNLGKCSTEADKFFGKSGGNLKQGENASFASEGWTPLPGLYPSYKFL